MDHITCFKVIAQKLVRAEGLKASHKFPQLFRLTQNEKELVVGLVLDLFDVVAEVFPS